MKYLKILGLASLASLTLMVFFGDSAASATVLCKTEITEGCAVTGWDYPNSTTLDVTLASGSSATLETGSGTVLDKCTELTMKLKTSNTGGTNETVKAEIETMNWGSGGSPCTKTTDNIALGKLEIHHGGNTGDGTLTTIGSEVTVNTIFGTCVYGSQEALTLGNLTHGTSSIDALIDINVVVLKTGGNAACPSTAKWTATYEVTSPTPLFVGQD